MTGLVESGKFAKLAGLPDDVRKTAIGASAETYAEKYVKLQAGEMLRLLTLADYENPYLTMHPSFEGRAGDAGRSGRAGAGVPGVKPVHWSVANETALAEAELEYVDREGPVGLCGLRGGGHHKRGLRGVRHRRGRPRGAGPRPDAQLHDLDDHALDAAGEPGDRGQPRFEYALVRVDGNITVLAAELVGQVAKGAKAEELEVLATTRGGSLLGLRYKHPFIAEAPRPLHGAGGGRLHVLHDRWTRAM